MNKKSIHTLRTLALLGAMAAGLWGCQKDDLAESSNRPQGELKLTVTDSGYRARVANDDNGGLGAPQTRTTEKGYQTTFTAGDQIGLYLVKEGVATATNVCMTLTDMGGGTLQWQPPTDVRLSATADRYFAYYPYQASPAAVAPTATTADAFFAGIISAWTPATDQSGTNYTGQDLMVGSGTPADGKLAITLAHQMGLAVIKLPEGVTDIAFKGFTPYEGVTGEYRYLVKPDAQTTLEGNFKKDGKYRDYTTAATVATGTYKVYTVK